MSTLEWLCLFSVVLAFILHEVKEARIKALEKELEQLHERLFNSVKYSDDSKNIIEMMLK